MDTVPYSDFPKLCSQFIIVALFSSLNYVVLMSCSFPVVYRILKLETRALLNHQEDKNEIYILLVTTPVSNSIVEMNL